MSAAFLFLLLFLSYLFSLFFFLSLCPVRGKKQWLTEKKVMARFMQVMGPKGPGLAVKKCHRGGRGSAGIALGAKDVSTLNRIDYFLLEGSDVRGRNEDFLRLPLGNTMASHWREWRQRHTSPLLQHEWFIYNKRKFSASTCFELCKSGRGLWPCHGGMEAVAVNGGISFGAEDGNTIADRGLL